MRNIEFWIPILLIYEFYMLMKYTSKLKKYPDTDRLIFKNKSDMVYVTMFLMAGCLIFTGYLYLKMPTFVNSGILLFAYLVMLYNNYSRPVIVVREGFFIYGRFSTWERVERYEKFGTHSARLHMNDKWFSVKVLNRLEKRDAFVECIKAHMQ